MTEDELKANSKLGEWREDRHNLEAARIFGGARTDETFPTAFQRYHKPEVMNPFKKRATPFTKPPEEEKGSLVKAIRSAFERPKSVGEHQASAPAIDPKNVVGLRPNIH